MNDAILPVLVLFGVVVLSLMVVRRRANTGGRVDVGLQKKCHELGDMVDATIVVHHHRSLEFDEIRATLFCEEHVPGENNRGANGPWRTLFSKSRTLKTAPEVSGEKSGSYACGLALPATTPDELTNSNSLRDVANWMQAQLNGAGFIAPGVKPAESYSELVSRFGKDDVHWRLEITLLRQNRSVYVQRLDVPVVGFGGVKRGPAGEEDWRAA